MRGMSCGLGGWREKFQAGRKEFQAGRRGVVPSRGVDRETQLGVEEGAGGVPGARGERDPGAGARREAQLAGPAEGGGGGSAPLTQAASQCLWR